MRIAITTLGCKINQYDSAVIQSRLEEKHSFVPFEDEADCYVINTCTVTDRADWEARQLVRRAKRLNPAAKVLVTGCYAQVNPAEVAEVPGVDFVVGLNRLDDLLRYVEEPARQSTRNRRERCKARTRRGGAGHASFAGTHARFSEDSRRLQLFVHLLHYSDRARPQPQRSAARSSRTSATVGRSRIQRDCSHRHSPRRLWS